jgi:phospholipase C
VINRLVSRRRVLGGVARAGLTATLFGRALARAVVAPAHHRSGTIADVEHVVILMQENRSFDHYFGTLNGVRGFADPRPIRLPNGEPVFSQSDGGGVRVRPFRFDAANTRFPVMHSLNHDWESTHRAWNQGWCDQWVPAKTSLTMGYVTREDIPYHFALADAFTICDAYHASQLGSTSPNRLYLLTGGIDTEGRGGGPVIDNSDITQIPGGKIFGRGWVSYAERLQSAGITWRAYRQGADPTSDDDSDGGMNSLLAFEAFREAKPGEPLYDFGVAPRRLEMLKADVKSDQLAQVSWIFPPRIFCEHPNWPPVYGAQYIARILDALTCNLKVWSKTVFLLMYDENDGFFDHMPPPAPPTRMGEGQSTVRIEEEIHPSGEPYGLGLRTPLIAISPWSRGGFVNSQLCDHTSVIRFLEARFGVHEPNISPWRRAVCGDLTSMFDFATPNAALIETLPRLDTSRELPDQQTFELFKAQFAEKPDPAVPAHFEPPQVELGPRRSRPLAYDLAVDSSMDHVRAELAFHNVGAIGAAFTVQDRLNLALPPRRYTVESGRSLADQWALDIDGRCDLVVLGPNGFERTWRADRRAADVTLQLRHRADSVAVEMVIVNSSRIARSLERRDGYSGSERTIHVGARSRYGEVLPLAASSGWYDFTFTGGGFYWRGCGHVETGSPSLSDPAIERTARAMRVGASQTRTGLEHE